MSIEKNKRTKETETLTSAFNLGSNVLPAIGGLLDVKNPHVIEDIPAASIATKNKHTIPKLGSREVRPWLWNTAPLLVWGGLNLSPCLLLQVKNPHIIVASPLVQAPKDQHAPVIKLYKSNGSERSIVSHSRQLQVIRVTAHRDHQTHRKGCMTSSWWGGIAVGLFLPLELIRVLCV